VDGYSGYFLQQNGAICFYYVLRGTKSWHVADCYGTNLSYYYLTFCCNKWLNLYPYSVTIRYRSGLKLHGTRQNGVHKRYRDVYVLHIALKNGKSLTVFRVIRQ